MKCKIIASREQLLYYGIELDLTDKIGNIIKTYSTLYYEIEFTRIYYGEEMKYSYDIPINMVELVE